ncbi:MAG: hypothetical protein WD491_03935 [Balneolales bacterium]
MSKPEELVLFWSGGKDAFLALTEIDGKAAVTLLTTFNEKTQAVPHQEIPLYVIKEQARQLNLKLLAVPLPDQCPNELYLTKLEQALKKITSKPKLVFGDLRLANIRTWREQVFHNMGYECRFPIWNKPYPELLAKLWRQPVEIHISAVTPPYQNVLKPGMKYDGQLVKNLPPNIDPLGENGEFHTVISFL